MDPQTNFGYSTVLTAPTPPASGVTIVLAAGEGGRFPAATTGDATSHFNLVISPAATKPLPSNAEIVRCTNRAGDTCTVTRTQEGTGARTILVGDSVALCATAKTFSDIATAIAAVPTGNITSTGADGAEPLAPSAGDLYLPNNGVHIERSTGAVWVPWGPLYPMTRPISTDFAWVNQGGATVSQTNGGIYLFGPANASIGWRMRTKAAPLTPYVITAAFLLDGLNVDFHQFGLLWRNSGGGGIVSFSLQTNPAADNPQLGPLKYTSATVFSAIYTQARCSPGRPLWLRIADDGANRICSYSPDGQNWQVLHTVGRTDFLTANEVGFGVNPENATFGKGITLLSWKET